MVDTGKRRNPDVPDGCAGSSRPRRGIRRRTGSAVPLASPAGLAPAQRRVRTCAGQGHIHDACIVAEVEGIMDRKVVGLIIGLAVLAVVLTLIFLGGDSGGGGGGGRGGY